MCKSLPPSGVSTCALNAWTFSSSKHGSDARLRNHFVLINIPQSADNHICMSFDNKTSPCIIAPTSKLIHPIYAHSEESASTPIFQCSKRTWNLKGTDWSKTPIKRQIQAEFKHEKIVEMYFSFLPNSIRPYRGFRVIQSGNPQQDYF